LKINILILIFFVSSSLWAQTSQEVDVKLKTQTKETGLVKQSLLFQASLNSVEKLAPEFQVNYLEFKKKLDLKFQDFFKNYKSKKLAERFGSSYAETLTSEEKTQFLQTLAFKEEELYQNYSGLLLAIKSQKVKNLKQDPADPESWSASFELELDKTKLASIFKRVMGEDSSVVSRLYLYTELDNLSFQWEEMNLSEASHFIYPIQTSWLQWFKDNLGNLFDDIQVCEQKCFQFYRDWSSAEATQLSIPLDYSDARLLRIHLKLKKDRANPSLYESSFSWEGRVILQDINTKKILGSFTLPAENKTFKNLDQKTLNSTLASYLYRLPLTSFLQLKNTLESNKAPVKVAPIILKGFRHLGDVQGYILALKSRGNLLGLDVVLSSFSKEEAFLTCYYKGEEKSFSDLLSGIKELKLSQTYNLIGDFSGVHHTIKFVTE
jgi:hypothetical protein